MASKLIGGDAASGAQRLVWRDIHGRIQPGPDPVLRCAQDGPESAPESELAQIVVSQQKRIQELEKEVEQRLRQAHQKGFSEGQAAGAQQASARLEPAMAKVSESIRELAAIRKRYFQEAEADAVRLAVAVARKVLHRELSVDPEALLGVVKAAFERLDAREIHRIRLHPEDRPLVQKHMAKTGLPSQIELIEDSTLERGGVVIETARGCLDASVGSQLREIERGLVDIVKRNSA